MHIEIEYCVPCGYLDKAADAQKIILSEFGEALEGVTLKTGNKGVFTFRANGEVIYTKPDEYNVDAIVDSIRAKL